MKSALSGKLIRRALLAALFLGGLTWVQLPWIRHALAPHETELRTATLRIVSHDCARQRGGEFTVEIADTEEARNAGLQHRRYLPRNRGMLFLWPDRKIRSMWMRDTPIQLDILFVDVDGTVTEVIHRRRPNSDALSTSSIPSRAALELRGGRAYDLDIAGGDYIVMPEFFSNRCSR